MKKYHDITRTLGLDNLTYPGDIIFHTNKYFDGNSTSSELTMSSHSGTHLDAPHHFLKSGPTLDSFTIDHFFLQALVADLSDVEQINKAHLIPLNNQLELVKAVLFKTSNSVLNRDKFNSNYTSISVDAAKYLLQFDLRLIGIDYLSIEPFDSESYPVHHLILQNGRMILEDINLEKINGGIYDLIVLPLKWLKSDGAPARAVLIES